MNDCWIHIFSFIESPWTLLQIIPNVSLLFHKLSRNNRAWIRHKQRVIAQCPPLKDVFFEQKKLTWECYKDILHLNMDTDLFINCCWYATYKDVRCIEAYTDGKYIQGLIYMKHTRVDVYSYCSDSFLKLINNIPYDPIEEPEKGYLQTWMEEIPFLTF